MTKEELSELIGVNIPVEDEILIRGNNWKQMKDTTFYGLLTYFNDYADQRVIDELQKISDIADREGIIALPVIKRIRELKQ